MIFDIGILAPAAGGVICVPIPAATNARNLPTVTSYLSSRKLLTVARFALSGYALSAATS